MKISFDLFHGECPPSDDAIEWLPHWWYLIDGLSIEKGILPGGYQWLLIGKFHDIRPAADIILTFINDDSSDTLFRADGEFVLFLYSLPEDRLLLCRDRFGILPVVFASSKQGLVFSLWLENTYQLTGIVRDVDPFLLTQWSVYRKTFSPYTPFRSIESLSSNHFLIIKNSEVARIDIPLTNPEGKKYYSIDSAASSLGQLLEESIIKRIDNNKRIGVLLSGGNDSSLVVALLRKNFSGELHTLFVNFIDNSRDYEEYANQVAQQFSTNHQVICLTPYDYVSCWADTINTLQTPLPMPCHIGLAKAMQTLSGKVDLLIDGDGADTVFGAGLWPQMIMLSKIGHFLPAFFQTKFLNFSQQISGNTVMSKISSMAFGALGTPLDKYPHAIAAITGEKEIDTVFGKGTTEDAISFRSSLATGEFYEGFFSYLMLHGLPMDIATAVRLAFNSGIVFSYPFLDYSLVQESMKLSHSLRYHYRTRKAVLKRYCLNYFDKEFVYKPKEGFGVPLGKWFATKEFEPYLKLPLEERSLKRGWWNEEMLKRVIDHHASGKGSDGSAEAIPWIAVNVELWARICIDGDSSEIYKI